MLLFSVPGKITVLPALSKDWKKGSVKGLLARGGVEVSIDWNIEDRSAAVHLHARVRQDYWGYAAKERFSNAELISESYTGIRPAPGYPACPDHTEKAKLWKLLDVEDNIGLRLTESYAMYPTAAVSGFYFSHPDARYFAVGKIDRDQLESYAERNGMTRVEAEKWLMPNLGYEPNAADVA